MIRLNKDLDIHEQDIEEAAEKEAVNNGRKEINLYAQKVLRKMQADKIPATPYNFQIYFESMSSSMDENTRKKVEEVQVSELESPSDEYIIHAEKELKKGFVSVKSMVNSSVYIYKNMGLIRSLLKKRIDELNSTTNPLTTTSIVLNIENDLGKFDDLVEQYITSIKADYQKSVKSLKAMADDTIYDTRFSVYNRRFLVKALEQELKVNKNEAYKCSIMLLKVKDSVINSLPGTQDKLVLNKNISKLLQKTSRRSDIVAHLGNGIFAMLMKYTDLEASTLACKRVADLIYSSSFFIGDQDIDIDLEIAVAQTNTDKNAEDIISVVSEFLPQSGKDKQLFIVAQLEEQKEEENEEFKDIEKEE